VARSLLRSSHGAISLTLSQMFIGAISIGISLFRGSEVNAGFHMESTLGFANYGSSKLAEDHARSANIVVNDNTVMGAIMGPRFAVEADNITMDANAAIACPTCPASPTCTVCLQYKKNKPRALLKLVWVRAKQMLLWGTLGKLSGDIDKLAFQQASGIVTNDVKKMDAKARIRFVDATQYGGDIWGGTSTDVACDLSMKDTLFSPMLGHAFQPPALLIKPNLLEGLPRILVQAMPKIICKVTSAAKNAALGSLADAPKLPEIEEIAEKTKKECEDLESSMRCSIPGGACGGGMTQAENVDVTNSAGGVQLSSKTQQFVSCRTATPTSPLRQSGSGYTYRADGNVVSCSFDRQKCEEEQLAENTDTYLREKLGLAKIVTNLAAALGGDEPRKPAVGGTSPQNFCSCAYSEKPLDDKTIGISDAARWITSFGTADPSSALRKRREYRACGRWYFPKRNGAFASVADDETPFVAAWKWNMTTKCQGVEQ
jgi:hypothetical protein